MGFQMKKILSAGFIATIGILALASQAQAGSRYCVYNPDDPACQDYYGGDGGDGAPLYPPRYGDGYGDNYDYPPPRPRRPVYNNDNYDDYDNYGQGTILSFNFGSNNSGRCSSIGNSLRRTGFRNVNAIDCAGREFRYTARRDGRSMVIYVASKNGRINSIRPN
jgi:hypothetical protein